MPNERWETRYCARCAVIFTAMTRGNARKYCDSCRDVVLIEKRQADNRKRTGRRHRRAVVKGKLIPYAGFDGSKTQGW